MAMKWVGAAILAAGLTAVGASGASAETIFRGTVEIVAVTAGCQNVQAGWDMNSQYHPGNVTGNDTWTAISVIHQHSAQSYSLGNLPFDGTFRNVTAGGIGWGDIYTWEGAQMMKVSQTPANLTPTSPYVYVRFKIKKFDNDSGGTACTATLAGSYVRDTQ